MATTSMFAPRSWVHSMVLARACRTNLTAAITRSFGSTAGGKKVAIVGSGPSGCYTAKYIQAAWDKTQTNGGQIDVIERLPTPYGLVRFGVAPDHPEVKNVQNDFDVLFEEKGVRYFGNVHVGDDDENGVTLDELRGMYDAVVVATGAQSDRRLGLPGEDELQGILSAREFVAWYNGHPEFLHIGEQVQTALSSSSLPGDDDVSVVVVGHGNVALDCARVLAKGGKGLYDTDLASHALPVLGDGVAKVTVVGRRGHVQGAFTIKEVRELINLQQEGFDASFRIRQEELDLGATPASLDELEGAGGRPKKRIDKLLRKAAADDASASTTKRVVDLRFLLSPSSWEASENDASRLGALVCERTRLEGEPGQQRAVGTGEMERIPAQLALLSIGYKGVPLPGLQDHFDADQGVVQHEKGRIERPSPTLGGLYAAGWLKRGPSGIIGTNIPDAKETVASVLEDLEADDELRDSKPDLEALLKERGVRTVDWQGYRRIEEKELSLRRSEAQPREKIIDVEEQIAAALT